MSLNLKKISDDELLKNTKRLAGTERKLLAEVLRHLAEIQRRKLFSPQYKSLYEYTIKELGYSEDQAARRISAMRLIQELPTVEAQVVNGSLSLTSLSLAQTHFRNESLDDEEKIETLRALENKTSREVARELLKRSSNPAKLIPDIVRPVSATMNELRLVVSDPALDKISRVKGLIAHQNPHLTNGELFELVLDLALEIWNPARTNEKSPAAPRVKVGKSLPENVRRPSTALKKDVWRKANGRCELCQSHFRLEIDHQVPFALGGKTVRENLRLLCRNCNQREAVRVFSS